MTVLVHVGPIPDEFQEKETERPKIDWSNLNANREKNEKERWKGTGTSICVVKYVLTFPTKIVFTFTNHGIKDRHGWLEVALVK